MIRRHVIPFGAECRDDGSVRFRLWAPAAKHVDVCLEDPQATARIPMIAADQGWFELVTHAAKPGSLYRFQIDDGPLVPDPASRFQPQDVHGPSEIVDPGIFDWQDGDWLGRPWKEAAIYELHVGAFSPAGTFSAVSERLEYLADLGVTALELMPLADFPGKRNWGYDGVYPYAPDSAYGRPEDLKQLIHNAHQRGIMVFLDVVYNHFGPEGNYLNIYAPQFFTDRHRTPWGNGIDFDGPRSRIVRDFFIHNALYWLTEYNFDGLRLDAVHAIADESNPDIVTELGSIVRACLPPDRYAHLILENDHNQSSLLRRDALCKARDYSAQWNDDIHHALHVLLTGEQDGYYSDYSQRTLHLLGRTLVEGFAYQGEPSAFRGGQARGEPTEGLPSTAFVSFLQNHDQIGNRAFGDRIAHLADPRAIRAAAAILLLAPSPPMIFMGEEFGSETPFLFFCDFQKDLATAVTTGRRSEFARFERFKDSTARQTIPDPNAASTFEASRLNWSSSLQPGHHDWLTFYHQLLSIRSTHITKLPIDFPTVATNYRVVDHRGLVAHWRFVNAAELTMVANLAATAQTGFAAPVAELIYATDVATENDLQMGGLPAWSVAWFLKS